MLIKYALTEINLCYNSLNWCIINFYCRWNYVFILQNNLRHIEHKNVKQCIFHKTEIKIDWNSRRRPLVEQELPTLPEHLNSSPFFSGFRGTRSLWYIYVYVLFLLAIVLSVLLRYTDSDYPFGIFKLFLLLFWIIQYIHLAKS